MFIKLFLLFFSSLNATEVHYTHETPPTVAIKVVKAQPQSHYLSPKAKYVFDLISSNGSTHTLVCHEEDHLNPEIVESYLIYSNIAHIQVKNFKFIGHKLCMNIAVYIESVFEFINDRDPIYIELNTKKFQVNRIILPNLDPYMDRLPQKNRLQIELLSKKN